ELDESVMLALASTEAEPLLALLDRTTAGSAARRFLLIDARLAGDPVARAAILAALGSDGAPVEVVRVDGRGIFDEPDRFLALSGRMRSRGDILVAATAFNDALAALAHLPADDLPEAPAGRMFVRRI